MYQMPTVQLKRVGEAVGQVNRDVGFIQGFDRKLLPICAFQSGPTNTQRSECEVQMNTCSIFAD